ncbi:MAG: SCO family protein [Pseudomonadota bacterium]|nr:SCO family protein [Pseudomonadota bacterium]
MKILPKQLRVVLFIALLPTIALGGCQRPAAWHATDVSGSVPSLALSMTRASDGKPVTAADYRGKVTLLYFGYTFCPDVCPMTLTNVAHVFTALGVKADNVRLLFVTVDPNRDTPDVLKAYVAAFGPHIEGLRGTPDQLASLARRYRVAYSVDPHGAGGAYEVTHSSGIYVFDASGKARLLNSSLSTDKPDIAGTVSDLGALLR